MALFGSDRPVLPSFKTAPDLDASERSPYDDLNRLDRAGDRNGDRAPSEAELRAAEAEQRAKELLERVLDRSGRDVPPAREALPPAPVKAAAPPPRRSNDISDPLIQGLFSKLPQPETEWPLAARQKWLQTAANIFDLMYAPNQSDAGELAIRVERSSAR